MELGQTKRCRVPGRSPRACQQCKTAKVRCSGSFPCARCARRRETCIAPDDGPKVSVPRKYLLEIERRAALATATSPECMVEPDEAAQAHPSPPPTASSLDNCQNEFSNDPVRHLSTNNEANVPTDTTYNAPRGASSSERSSRNSNDDEHQDSILNSNPLVKDTIYIRDPAGRYRYMGHTSTWSFIRRVISLIEEYSPPNPQTPPEPFNTDGTAFRLTWTPTPLQETPDVSDLPPIDLALYLFHTVKFNLGQFFQLIDEPLFMFRLNELEANPVETAQKHRLWFAEYLIVMAFGKALFSAPSLGSAPAGYEYAARCLAILPDFAQLHDEGLLSVEVLSLVALYFHSIDMRVSAYQYIGQALRFSYVEGIHRDMPEHVVGKEVSRRCKVLWWTVYVLDRRLSALMGAPSSISDDEIATGLPLQTDGGQSALALALSVKLSRLLATIVRSVYSVQDEIGKQFIRNTKAVIESLAEAVQEGDEASDGTRNNHPTRLMNDNTLMYHHCILQATRPVVMCLLKSHVGSLESPTGRKLWESQPVAALLKSSVSSALSTLGILCSLQEQRLMETFLPFHLEYAFSSAVALCIIQAVLPSFVVDHTWGEAAMSLLDIMSRQGSVVAGLRKSELIYLMKMLCLTALPVDEDGGLRADFYPGRCEATADGAANQGFWRPDLDMAMMGMNTDHLFDLAFQLDTSPLTDIVRI